MLVRELMNPKPVVVTPEMSVPAALSLMRERKAYQLPVVTGAGKLVGVVTEQDLLHASATSVTSLSVWEIPSLLAKITVEMVMVKEVITIAKETAAEDAAVILADKSIACLPVMDGERLVGLITKNDLFKALIDLMGGRRRGVRIWASTPAVKGTVARIAGAISSASGNIVGIGYQEVMDPSGSRWEMTIKVQDVPKEKLVELLKPVVTEILDVREC